MGPVIGVAGVGVCIVHRIAGAPSRRPTCGAHVGLEPERERVGCCGVGCAARVPRLGAVIPLMEASGFEPGECARQWSEVGAARLPVGK